MGRVKKNKLENIKKEDQERFLNNENSSFTLEDLNKFESCLVKDDERIKLFSEEIARRCGFPIKVVKDVILDYHDVILEYISSLGKKQ